MAVEQVHSTSISVGNRDRFSSQHVQSEHLAAGDKSDLKHVSTEDENDAKVEVPVIDLAGLSSGDVAMKEKIIREIMEACEKWGIFQVVNSGVSEKVFHELDDQCRQFFSSPVEVKERANCGLNRENYGFMWRFNTDPLYISWREVLTDFSTTSDMVAMIEKIWPDGNPAFSDAVLQFSDKVQQLGEVLLELIAQGLGLHPTFFSQHFKRASEEKRFHWRFLSYPPCPESTERIGISPHTDPTVLTLLKQDSVCGLQAMKGDKWVDVASVPGALVVNLGDCLEAWTNGRFTSVLHRVVVNQTTWRLSNCLLLTPPESVVIQAPQELIDDEHPQLFKPFTSKELTSNLYAKVSDARISQDASNMKTTKILFHDFARIRLARTISSEP